MPILPKISYGTLHISQDIICKMKHLCHKVILLQKRPLTQTDFTTYISISHTSNILITDFTDVIITAVYFI